MTGYTSAWKGAAVLACALLLAGSASAVLLDRGGRAAGVKPDALSMVSAAPSDGTIQGTGSGADTGSAAGAGTGADKGSGADLAPSAGSIQLETYAGIPCEARLGDGLTVTVGKPPKHGTADADGDSLIYTPEAGFTGVDRFTYTVTDSAGRVSKSAKVTVRVKKCAVAYEDMENHPAALAAQELAEAGVFTGENIGGRYFFGPDETLTRSEFLAMAMEALGRKTPEVSITGFCDDGAIPAWAKPYVSAAVSAGILRGVSTEEGAAFLGNEPVTWQQAAAMLDRALGTADVDLAEWFGDRAEPDLWAAQSVGNLEASGILAAGSFGSLTMERALTREGAARILSSARAAAQSEEASCVLAWLREAVG